MARRIASAAGAGAGWLGGVCARSDGMKMVATATMAKRERQIGFMVGRVWKIRAVKANNFTAVICPRAWLRFQISDRDNFLISRSISFTAVSMPAETARLTMLWPMFNSTRCGTRNSAGRFS